jgi:DNA-binding IscR family transcriptional regulator
MLEAEDRMRQVLSSQTLADLARHVGTKAPHSHAGKVVHWIETRKEQA